MATNTGKGSRKGAVKQRTQILNSATGQYVKRDKVTGQFVAVKKDGTPFKGVTREQRPLPIHPKATLEGLRKAEKAVQAVMARKRAA
ncbi:MAG: hypothetical protein H7330_01315 [Hymenobacteraceae bacterium]|nr:hypothetical protein [Hymenobacteraceae bacterium]